AAHRRARRRLEGARRDPTALSRRRTMSSGAVTNPQQAEAPALRPPLPPRSWRRIVFIALGGVAAAALVLLAPRLGKRETAPATQRDVPVVEGDRIRFPPEFAKRASIVIAPVERREVAPLVVLPGTVELDSRRVAAVGTRIPGRVRKVLKFEGEEVKAGDVLAGIESAELGRAQTGLDKAHPPAAPASPRPVPAH